MIFLRVALVMTVLHTNEIKYYDLNRLVEERVYLILQLVGHHSECQARNPQAGTDAETMGECWLLACTP